MLSNKVEKLNTLLHETKGRTPAYSPTILLKQEKCRTTSPHMDSKEKNLGKTKLLSVPPAKPTQRARAKPTQRAASVMNMEPICLFEPTTDDDININLIYLKNALLKTPNTQSSKLRFPFHVFYFFVCCVSFDFVCYAFSYRVMVTPTWSPILLDPLFPSPCKSHSET